MLRSASAIKGRPSGILQTDRTFAGLQPPIKHVAALPSNFGSYGSLLLFSSPASKRFHLCLVHYSALSSHMRDNFAASRSIGGSSPSSFLWACYSSNAGQRVNGRCASATDSRLGKRVEVSSLEEGEAALGTGALPW